MEFGQVIIISYLYHNYH